MTTITPESINKIIKNNKECKYFSTRWINLEFSSKCNLRCKWCILGHKKYASFMSEETLLKIK